MKKKHFILWVSVCALVWPVFYSLILYLSSLQGFTTTPMRLGTMRPSA